MLGLRALALTPEAIESVDKNRVDQGSILARLAPVTRNEVAKAEP